MIRSSRLSDPILGEGGRALCYDLLPRWRFGLSTWYRGVLADSTLFARRLAVHSIFTSVTVRLGLLVVVRRDV
jgi:hypothetical protein